MVEHGRGEYVKKGTDIHSNTAESVFSLLKRDVIGTFHSVSKKHLPNYLNPIASRRSIQVGCTLDFYSGECRDQPAETLVVSPSIEFHAESRGRLPSPDYARTVVRC